MLPPIHEDCSNLDDLPDLAFMLDGNELLLPPEAYVPRLGKGMDRNDKRCVAPWSGTTRNLRRRSD